MDLLETLQLFMAAVTQGLVLRRFAATEEYFGIFSRRIAHRRKSSVLVRAIAEWLAGAQSAGAPPVIFAGFNENTVGGVCSAFGLVHFRYPLQ